MDKIQLATELRRRRAHSCAFTPAQESLEFFMARFPLIMREAHRAVINGEPMRHSLANFGIHIPAHWFRTVYLLCARLERMAETMTVHDALFLLNIKEKWGELRVYLEFPEAASNPVEARIAEDLVAAAVERCGRLIPKIGLKKILLCEP